MGNNGWNRDTSDNHRAAIKRNAPRRIRGLCAALLVVIPLVAVVFWYLKPAAPAPVVQDVKKPKKLIKAVERAPAPIPVEKTPSNAEILRARFPALKIPDDWAKPYPPQAYWPDGRLKKYSRYVKVITNSVSRASMSVEEKTFTNYAERDIAGMLLVEPGDTLVGDYTYDESFTERFLESLKTEIPDSDEDTPFQKELKQAVRETKKELKARYDKGENLAEIMAETRKQFKELGLYREDIQRMVDEAKSERGDDLTEQDEKDLIEAANKMLEERGCKPLELPQAFIEQLELQNIDSDKQTSEGERE